MCASRQTRERGAPTMLDDMARIAQKRLAATIGTLFRRCPALCGFAVQHSGGLFVSEITVDSRGGRQTRAAVCDEIVTALGELIDECPEACELLAERTFARVLH
jgi:hypothetical protein